MKKITAIAFLLIGLVSLVEEAEAYIIVPEVCRSDSDQCVKSGNMDFIFIFGEIQYTDSEFFNNLDQNWPNDKKIPIIWLESGGGHINAAAEIGRVLRKRHAIVATGNPVTKEDKYYCASACVLIAAGAEERHLREIGLHRPYLIEHKNKKDERIKPDLPANEAKIKSYFTEMGIHSDITEMMYDTPSEKLQELIFDESGDSDQPIVRFGFHMPLSEIFPDQGFPKAKFHRDMDQDEQLEFAALNGDAWAAFELADYYTRKSETRLPSPILERKWLQFAVDHGNVHAMHNMAVALSGTRWGKPNYKLAATYYKLAVELGFGPSQNNLGWNYYVAHGVKRNVPLAVHLITASALQGEPFAYGSLCEMYGRGDVFPIDKITGSMWCNLAIDQMPQGSGLNASIVAMTKISKNMKTTEIGEARRRASEWRPLKSPTSVMRGDED